MLTPDKAQLAGWIQESGHSDRIDATLGRIVPSAETDRKFDAPERRRHLRSAFDRIDLSRNTITLHVNRTAIVKSLLEVASASQVSGVLSPLTISVPIDIKRRGVETRIILLDGRAPSRRPDAALVKLIARAHTYLAKLTDASGRSLTEIAAECRTELSEVSRILPLAFLSPSIVDAIMTGRQSASLTAQRLLRLSDLPNLWRDQADILN